MANLYSQYASGVQLTAGVFAGSSLGVSGLNPIVDRLNSISNNDGAVIGSMVSGTSTRVYGTFISGTNVYSTTISGATLYGTTISGTNIRGTLIGNSTGSLTGVFNNLVCRIGTFDLGPGDKVGATTNHGKGTAPIYTMISFLNNTYGAMNGDVICYMKNSTSTYFSWVVQNQSAASGCTGSVQIWGIF